MLDLWRDFWICETGTGQQVAQLHERYDDDDDDDDDDKLKINTTHTNSIKLTSFCKFKHKK